MLEMPKIVVAAGVVSIALIVFGASPCLAALADTRERRSEEVRPAPDRAPGLGLGTPQRAARASCPPRWPYIVLTCVA